MNPRRQRAAARWRRAGVAGVLLGIVAGAPTPTGAAHAREPDGTASRVPPRGLPPGHPVAPPSTPPPRGVTLGINGAIVAGIGATFMGLAAVALAEGASCVKACGFWEEASGQLLLIFGAPAFAVGVPLFAVGVHRHRRWRAWERRRLLEIRPRVGSVRGGATAGVVLRF